MSDYGLSIFGLPSSIPLPDLRAIPALLVESHWSQPLAHILEVGGWTIDDICRSRRIAAEVRVLWKIFKAAERQRLDRERKNAVRERLVYRKEGLPVACPLCGEPGACACRLDSLRALQEGTGFGRVSKERPRYRPFRQVSFAVRQSGQ
jgi:hypothetical protein